jgi:tetratricopeptide (TPR) repeat protein
MKCLEKDRTRRYETVNGLATDLQRHLNNEPVVARPPTNFYRFQKMVHRNKLAFAAASAVVATLVLGLGISTWMFFREKAARQEVEIARSREIKLRHQVEQMPILFFLGSKLRDQDKWSEAEALYRKALVEAKQLYGDEHIEVVYMLCYLASALERQSKFIEAENFFRQALQISARLARGDNPSLISMSLDGSFRLSVPDLLDALVGVLRRQAKFAEADQVYAEYVPLLRAKLPADDYELTHAITLWSVTLIDEEKFADAEPLARESLALRQRQTADDWRVFNSQHLVGASLLGQKRYAEAEPLLISGYEGMKQRENKISADFKLRVKESLQRIVQLYEATGQSEKAAEWKKTLTEFDNTEAEKNVATPKP